MSDTDDTMAEHAGRRRITRWFKVGSYHADSVEVALALAATDDDGVPDGPIVLIRESDRPHEEVQTTRRQFGIFIEAVQAGFYDWVKPPDESLSETPEGKAPLDYDLVPLGQVHRPTKDAARLHTEIREMAEHYPRKIKDNPQA